MHVHLQTVECTSVRIEVTSLHDCEEENSDIVMYHSIPLSDTVNTVTIFTIILYKIPCRLLSKASLCSVEMLKHRERERETQTQRQREDVASHAHLESTEVN